VSSENIDHYAALVVMGVFALATVWWVYWMATISDRADKKYRK
jgi:cbb3-type cytochrome oxidase subunit 3